MIDAVLGVVVALLVLAQAFLLARVAARAFDGSVLGDVTSADGEMKMIWDDSGS